jgi:hypothetical protein
MAFEEIKHFRFHSNLKFDFFELIVFGTKTLITKNISRVHQGRFRWGLGRV